MLTVVALEGNGYRGVGARMVVDSAGKVSGALSGGCLEADLYLQAKSCMDDGKSRLVRYDTRNDASVVFGLHLGCEGVLHILIEAFSSSPSWTFDYSNRSPYSEAQPSRFLSVNSQEHPSEVIALLQRQSQLRSHAVHLLIVDVQTSGHCTGRHFFIENEDQLDLIPSETVAAVRSALLEKHAASYRAVDKEGSIRSATALHDSLFACEFCCPQPIINIIGAGYDAIPLQRLCAQVGWKTIVVDKSSIKAQIDRFPNSERVVSGTVNECAAALEDGLQSACVYMSHNVDFDIAMLQKLRHRQFSFIGILGARKRTQTLLQRIAETDPVLATYLEAHVHSPIGLDLGAETAEEIALSIVAELQSFFRSSSARSLSKKEGRIHEQRQSIVQQVVLF